MFGHLFSTFSSTAANQPAAMKRQRAEQGTLDSAMPQAAQASNSSQATTPPSTAKGKGKGKGKSKSKQPPKGKGKSKNRISGNAPNALSSEEDPWGMSTWDEPPNWSSYQTAQQSNDLLMKVAKIALRHELQLHSLQQDTRLYIFLKPNQEYSVLPLMLQLATEWRATMEQTPEKLTVSLREVMIRGLLKEWRARLQAFQSNEEARGTAQRLQWLDSVGHWNHMHWCPTKQDLVLTEKTESQSTEEILKQIGELEDMISGDSIRTFKSLKHLRESYQTEWVQFLVEIQLRGPGDRLWTIFNGLIGSAALHLLAARLRRDRYPLSGLAQSIQTQLW